jgi:phosphatidylglycerol---prolipoprotein diacylglyceryl transferase
MAIAFLVIGLLLLLAGLYFLIKTEVVFVKDRLNNALTKKDLYTYGASVLAISLAGFFLMLSLFLAHPEWQANNDVPYGKAFSLALVGAFLFAMSNCTLWSGFIFHYYKKNQEAKQRKLFSYFLFASIPVVLLSFLMWTEGLGDYMVYPLVNGFSITGSGWIWTTGFEAGNYKPLHIAFYGLIILFGVLVCYWVCDHRFYQEFHKHGILDTVVLVAFPSGVIGARIWYVVGNWSREGFDKDFSKVFQIWNGGLTIIGGALGGVIAGLLFLLIARKYVNPRWAMDVCVPSILLAQAIGRWGNFFNVEVYGNAVESSGGWQLLPNWLLLQMNCSTNGTYLPAGQIHVPLFLIEGLLNVAGYFVIAYGIRHAFHKWLSRGDLAGCYFVWYGLFRMILEPLRDTNFNMGTDNEWSVWGSLGYILIGLSIILFDHLLDFEECTHDRHYLVPGLAGCFAFVALFMPFFNGIKGIGTGYLNGAYTSVSESYWGFALIFGDGSCFRFNWGLFIAYFLLLAGFVSYILLAHLAEKAPYRQKQALYLSVNLGLLLAGLLFFLAKNLTGLTDGTAAFGGMNAASVSYNLSSGFLLTGYFAFLAAFIGCIPLIVNRMPHEGVRANA